MGLSRRFLNLIVNEHTPGVTSLCSIDLHELFYPPPPAAAGPLKLAEELSLPTPTFTFRGSQYCCMPVADRKVLCTDRNKHAFLFDAATRHVVTIPTRRAFKWRPASIFVPSSSDDDPDGTLFVMEKWATHEARREKPEFKQFEAFVYRRSSKSSPAKSWHSQLLPPLPHLHNPRYWQADVGIGSYAVVGGGSHICVSLVTPSPLYKKMELRNEIAGTYCLDTTTHTWSKVGDWTLPFVDKVQYVPELKLWFGVDSEYRLAAVDLSAAMENSEPPQLVGAWEEEEVVDYTAAMMKRDRRGLQLLCPRLPKPKLAYLGSGKFCFARSFNFSTTDLETVERVAVLSGVEVVTPPPPQVLLHAGGSSRDDDGAGEAKLQMIRHKSRLLPPHTFIGAVF